MKHDLARRELWLALMCIAPACNDDDTAPPTGDGGAGGTGEASIETLGESLFFDETLSIGENQSCATCHGDAVGWTGPDEGINQHGAVYEASISGRFGNRKPPASAYASFAPPLTVDDDGNVVGGNFLDGRATGWQFGSPIVDQAQGPFLNPVEQALPDAAAVVERVCSSSTATLFRRVWGEDACHDVDVAFEYIARSIAAFEASAQVSPFSSKYDAVLAGRALLSPEEERGLALFDGKAQCSNCHSIDPDVDAGAPLFTDFTFDNLGTPANPENPFYDMDQQEIDGEPINPEGDEFVDRGLGDFIEQLARDDAWRDHPFVTDAFRSMSHDDLEELARETRGAQRVPTLRNVDKRPTDRFVKAYTHNGYFKSLESLVHFYNTRDVLPRCPELVIEAVALAEGCWPAPEVDENVNRLELGALGLSEEEEAALVAFLRTLSDGFE